MLVVASCFCKNWSKIGFIFEVITWEPIGGPDVIHFEDAALFEAFLYFPALTL